MSFGSEENAIFYSYTNVSRTASREARQAGKALAKPAIKEIPNSQAKEPLQENTAVSGDWKMEIPTP